jgi:hypothetical protein
LACAFSEEDATDDFERSRRREDNALLFVSARFERGVETVPSAAGGNGAPPPESEAPALAEIPNATTPSTTVPTSARR